MRIILVSGFSFLLCFSSLATVYVACEDSDTALGHFDSTESSIRNHQIPDVAHGIIDSAEQQRLSVPSVGQAVTRNVFSKDLFLCIYMGVFCIFLVLRVYYHKFLPLVQQSIIDVNLSVKLLENKNLLVRRSFFLLNTIFYLNAGLFLALVLDFYFPDSFSFSSLQMPFILGALVFFYYFFKELIIRLLAFLFAQRELASEYIHNIFLTNKNIGLWLFPAIFMLLYLPEKTHKTIIIISCGAISMLFILRVLRIFELIMKKNISRYYTILYLCTLEILPILIIYKVVNEIL